MVNFWGTELVRLVEHLQEPNTTEPWLPLEYLFKFLLCWYYLSLSLYAYLIFGISIYHYIGITKYVHISPDLEKSLGTQVATWGHPSDSQEEMKFLTWHRPMN